MPHLGKDELVRAAGAGRSEIARMAGHLARCPACRALAASVLREGGRASARDVPLRGLLETAAFERATAIDCLLARAELAALRRLTRGAQKERVIRSRACHTLAFFDALLDALRNTPHSREEAESLANLAVLAVRGIDPAEGSAAFKHDRLAMIWIETANARRIRGEWPHAQAALQRANEHRTVGTGDKNIQARWLSIAGSLHWDQGRCDEAMASLEESRRAYSACGDWPQVGRTLVIMAHCVMEDEPQRALDLLDRAGRYPSDGDASLRPLVERLRADCLITLHQVEEALRVFHEAERLRSLHNRPRAALRATFIAARLLESFGHGEDAGILFDAVVSEELDRGHFKDAVLNLVYVFGFHLRRGSPDRAAELGVRVLDELDQHYAAANVECRSVLAELIEAARGESLDEGRLRAVRAYLRVEWNRPRPAAPKVASEEAAPSLPKPPAPTPARKLVEPLLAEARWQSLQRETRREQHARVARSPEYHTVAFVELLLGHLREAPTRDEAEFAASLAAQAIEPLEVPAHFKHDLQAQLWSEVANARRVASEWSKASAALAEAEKHLAKGSGDPLLKARAQAVAASLLADQGRRVEALATLEECVALYESRGAGQLVARTLVQMAHTLVEIDPARALTVVGEAVPMMPDEDVTLRCHAENIRTECMIDLGEVDLALQTFDAAEPLRSGASPLARHRSEFKAARLLEHLGHYKEAVQLFEALIADAFDREKYREAFLDLLYLVEVHLRQEDTEKAVALCRLAIDRLDFFGLGHEQLRTVWMQLGEAAMRRAIRPESLVEVREFLKVHWKHPAAKPPRFSF